MSYLQLFPKSTMYDKVVTDLNIRAEFTYALEKNVMFYDYLDVLDGETPEMLAQLLYGNPEYHWILLVINGIEDPYTDWPLSELELSKYIDDKYLAPDDVIYYLSNSTYVLGAGIQVDPTQVDAGQRYAVTGRAHEIMLNDSKRRIKAVKPAFVPSLQGLLESVMRNVGQ